MKANPFTREVENLIANFRGLPEDPSRSRIRPVRTIEDLVAKLVHRHRIGTTSPEEAIRDAWPDIIGKANEQFAHPSRIDRDTRLIIAVNDPVVRQELQFNKHILISRIQKLPGCDRIREVVFKSG